MKKIDKYIPTRLPSPYEWVHKHASRYGPNIMREALKTHGLREIRGTEHAQEILDMADFLGGVIEDFYNADEIPWCGLAVSYWIKKAGFEPPKDYSQVRARDFAKWGTPAEKPSFGDVMVFWRGSPAGRDGHVGLYVCETPGAYHILGGNQGNMVNIAPISKERLITARRCPWRIMQPHGVQPFVTAMLDGRMSENEA